MDIFKTKNKDKIKRRSIKTKLIVIPIILLIIVIGSIASISSTISRQSLLDTMEENGRGFAVVADEIRKLAEQSNMFTEQISSVINELANQTANAVDTMEELEKVILTQSESVNITNEKFNGILTFFGFGRHIHMSNVRLNWISN